MTEKELESIQKAYAEAMYGRSTPECIFTPDGAFFSDGRVANFDENGNFYALSEEEQARRREKFKKRLECIDEEADLVRKMKEKMGLREP